MFLKITSAIFPSFQHTLHSALPIPWPKSAAMGTGCPFPRSAFHLPKKQGLNHQQLTSEISLTN
jgi:hypothetical protein